MVTKITKNDSLHICQVRFPSQLKFRKTQRFVKTAKCQSSFNGKFAIIPTSEYTVVNNQKM